MVHFVSPTMVVVGFDGLDFIRGSPNTSKRFQRLQRLFLKIVSKDCF